MKTFLGILLMVGVALGGVFLFAPDRIKNQTLAAIGFLASSFGRAFEVAADKVTDAKKFVVERVAETKEKADAIVNPKSPRERRAEILDDLEAALVKLENPQTPPTEKQKLAAQARELIDEAEKHNEDEPGFLDTIVGALTGSNNQRCKLGE